MKELSTCDQSLKQLIESNLNTFDVDIAEDPQARAAAVAIVVTDQGFGADLSGLPQ